MIGNMTRYKEIAKSVIAIVLIDTVFAYLTRRHLTGQEVSELFDTMEGKSRGHVDKEDHALS